MLWDTGKDILMCKVRVVVWVRVVLVRGQRYGISP